jgi:Holliday junction resolvase-like predicted endonuclease
MSPRFPIGVATTYNAFSMSGILHEHEASQRRGRRATGRRLPAFGVSPVERNFRVRGGEIDLICRDGTTTVFVEVRLRSRATSAARRQHHRRPSRPA